MRRDNILIVFGILIFFMPFIGIPDEVSSTVISFIGVGVVALSASRRLSFGSKDGKIDSKDEVQIPPAQEIISETVSTVSISEISPEPVIVSESIIDVQDSEFSSDKVITKISKKKTPSLKPRKPRKSKTDKDPDSFIQEPVNSYHFVDSEQVSKNS